MCKGNLSDITILNGENAVIRQIPSPSQPEVANSTGPSGRLASFDFKNPHSYSLNLLKQDVPHLFDLFSTRGLNALIKKITHPPLSLSYIRAAASIKIEKMNILERITNLFLLLIYAPLSLISNDMALLRDQAICGKKISIVEDQEAMQRAVFNASRKLTLRFGED